MFKWRPFLSAKEVFLGGQRKEGLVGRQHFSRILWRGQKEKPRIKEVGPFLARLLIILARVDCQLFFPCSKQKFSHQRKRYGWSLRTRGGSCEETGGDEGETEFPLSRILMKRFRMPEIFLLSNIGIAKPDRNWFQDSVLGEVCTLSSSPQHTRYTKGTDLDLWPKMCVATSHCVLYTKYVFGYHPVCDSLSTVLRHTCRKVGLLMLMYSLTLMIHSRISYIPKFDSFDHILQKYPLLIRLYCASREFFSIRESNLTLSFFSDWSFATIWGMFHIESDPCCVVCHKFNSFSFALQR